MGIDAVALLPGEAVYSVLSIGWQVRIRLRVFNIDDTNFIAPTYHTLDFCDVT